VIELSAVIDLAKLVLDCARAYGQARQTSRGINAEVLIRLHESFCNLSRSTIALRDEKVSPGLTYGTTKIHDQWYHDFQDALAALDDVDIATVRVYSTELADWLSTRVGVYEVEPLELEACSFAISEDRVKQLLKLRDSIDARSPQICGGMLIPIILEQQPNDALTLLAGVLDGCTSELRSFIKQNWPLEKL
jgi:hypothetical protein